MNICLDELLRTIATALDAVEGDLLGASTHHGKRIATLCAAMARRLGLSDDEAFAVSACALLHDNALTEYILSERPGEGQMNNLRLHSVYGQRNVEALPFKTPVEGFVLYHHEWADGSGPFRKSEGEYPLSGIEVLCEWAANHHEKLDGSGYPMGYGADKLDFISRLLSCVDIYQAVSEERPYRSHAETMPILYEMAERCQLEAGIVGDLDAEMARFEGGELPHPEGAVRFTEPR